MSGHSLCSPLATCRSWADRSSPYRGRSLRNTMAAAVAQSLARMEAFRVTWRTARATVSPAEAAAGGRPAAEPREEARPAQPGPDAVSSLPLPLCLRAPGLAPSRCPSPPCWVTPRWRLGKRRVGTRAERPSPPVTASGGHGLLAAPYVVCHQRGRRGRRFARPGRSHGRPGALPRLRLTEQTPELAQGHTFQN